MTVFQLISTRRFSVFDPIDENIDKYRGESSSNSDRIGNGNAIEAEAKIASDPGPDAAEETAAERNEAEYGGVKIPCMRLRDLNKRNASRLVG